MWYAPTVVAPTGRQGSDVSDVALDHRVGEYWARCETGEGGGMNSSRASTSTGRRQCGQAGACRCEVCVATQMSRHCKRNTCPHPRLATCSPVAKSSWHMLHVLIADELGVPEGTALSAAALGVPEGTAPRASLSWSALDAATWTGMADTRLCGR